jgi:N-acetylneuraminate synthase
MSSSFRIGERVLGPGRPVYVVAELSANHAGEIDHALRALEAAHAAGADAVKVQTYNADTLTIDADRDAFRIQGTAWSGRTLHDLYAEGSMPWEWQRELRDAAHALGLDFFSTAFDASAADFLDELGVPVHKVASFELVDLALVDRLARSGKPLIMSTGMATLEEIDDAVSTARAAGAEHLMLLKCTSAYPAPADAMNLRAIPDLAARFGVPVGLSDHTLDPTAAVAAVALGAVLVEKHFTLDRALGGPDASFSLEPDELATLVRSVRDAQAALGDAAYGPTDEERASVVFRRSLFVVADVSAGDPLTPENVRSIRPGYGLAPKHLPAVLGRRAARDLPRGTPLDWDMLA